jgi:TorA maturation chaperone TorD
MNGISDSAAKTSDVHAALGAAAAWRLIGLLFERPRSGWEDEITALGNELQDATLQQAVAEARRAISEHGSSTVAAAYLAIFGPGGGVSPREVAYRGREDPGNILADLSAFHAAFAFHPRAEDPLDHVAVEAGFVGYLHLKEAFARSNADAEATRTSAEAAESFLTAHLRTFAEPLCHRLQGTLPHLQLAARALLERTGPAPEPYHDSLRDGDPGEEDCLSCDGCPSN